MSHSTSDVQNVFEFEMFFKNFSQIHKSFFVSRVTVIKLSIMLLSRKIFNPIHVLEIPLGVFRSLLLSHFQAFLSGACWDGSRFHFRLSKTVHIRLLDVAGCFASFAEIIKKFFWKILEKSALSKKCVRTFSTTNSCCPILGVYFL